MRFPINRWTTHGILLLAGLFGLFGCSSYRPTPKTPEAAAPVIRVDGESLPTVSFDKLFTDIPGGRVIGYFYEGLDYARTFAYKWDENFENVTKELNFMAQDILVDAGYRAKDGGLGELQLKGTIRKLSFNTYSYKASFDQAECELKWELYRTGEKDPYYTRLTNGAGRVDSTQSGAIRAAFELALHSLLAEEEFVDAVGSQK